MKPKYKIVVDHPILTVDMVFDSFIDTENCAEMYLSDREIAWEVETVEYSS